jgi:competence protein ComEC
VTEGSRFGTSHRNIARQIAAHCAQDAADTGVAERSAYEGMLLRHLFYVCLAWFAMTLVAEADEVTPNEEVRQGLRVRELPTTDGAVVVGTLRRGERALVVESVPSWYLVRLPSGINGYVSKRWVRLIPEAPAVNVVGMPFSLHTIDVGTGDGLILDMGEVEILIDGGMTRTPLGEYATAQLIQDPIELAIVTHADSDHWLGMSDLLKAGGPNLAHPVLEFWEPGFDRPCSPLASYATFIGGIQRSLEPSRFKRPLRSHHVPAVESNLIEPFEIAGIPGVQFTLLHADPVPEGHNCAYKINNASIVVRIDVGGVRVLLTGDANGKLRSDAADITPAHVEGKLLALEAAHPGVLKADVLKVAHHGSETSNTQAFIDAVRPKFAVISASTRHHLPDPSVVSRYERAGAIVLRTDASRRPKDDPIVCLGNGAGDVECNYADEFE